MHDLPVAWCVAEIHRIVASMLSKGAYCMRSVVDQCLHSRHYVNLVIAGEHPAPQWLAMADPTAHLTLHEAREYPRSLLRERTITAPFDTTVLNDLDRCHLVMDTVGRVPAAGEKDTVQKKEVQKMLTERKRTSTKKGRDLPEIRNLKWPL